jgi:hypothetical protein
MGFLVKKQCQSKTDTSSCHPERLPAGLPAVAEIVRAEAGKKHHPFLWVQP